MAPFGQVATWDPARLEGVTVHRLTEFPASDLFLDTELAPDKDGNYTVPAAPDGERCIGLEWNEERRLTEVGLEFAAASPSADGVRLEGWIKAGPEGLGVLGVARYLVAAQRQNRGPGQSMDFSH